MESGGQSEIEIEQDKRGPKKVPKVFSFLESGLIRRTLVYTVSGSISALVAFFLLPVLTRFLSPYDFGVVETFTALTTCLSGIVLIGGNTILAKEYFDLNRVGQQRLIGQIILLVLCSAASISGVLYVVEWSNKALAHTFKIEEVVIYLAIVVAAANAVIALTTTLLQVQKKAIIYTLYVNAKTILELSISLSAIILLGLKWQGRLAGIMISSLSFAVVGLFFLEPIIDQSVLDLRNAKRLAVLGLPLVAAHISVWIYGMVDRVMISNMFDMAATGVYSVGFRFATVVGMVETAFSVAWMPYFYENIRLNDRQVDERIVRMTFMYAAALLTFAVAFGWGSRWLITVMVDSRFSAARSFTFLLCMGFWFSGLWKLLGCYLIAAGNTKIYGLITSATAIFHIGLTLYLLRHIGIIGAAWATMLSFAVATITTFIIAARLRPMPWLSALKC